MFWLAVLFCALLYRCPRGGPGGDVWRRWIGFAPGSTVASLTWAVGSAAWIWTVTGTTPWFIPAAAAAMFLGEMVPTMRYATGPTPNYWKASLLGCAMLNPLLGPIYWLARKSEGRVPTYGPLLDGWTCYAELGCGLVTGASYLMLALAIK